ncbi:MAG: RagB/SusD family nutrient uptake outer membrane protein [Bacteroides sp.]|nr:RagB/SusD family nutrient uptake outer membrane protein [Bacteroides sp.]
MKKIVSIVTCAVWLIASSCSDSFLQSNPNSAINESEFYQTDDDFFKAIVSVYHTCQDVVVQTLQYTLPLSDEAHAGGGSSSDFADLQRLNLYNITATGNAGWWSGMYQGIYKVNTILSRLDDAPRTTEAHSLRIRGEAHFMRALFYYYLYTMYGGVVLIDHPLAPSEYFDQERATAEATYRFILEDVNRAIEYLPAEIADSEKGRVGKDAAWLLKARTVLMGNDESLMDEIATEMKGIIDSGRYELYDDFETMWLREGEFCRENLWEIVNSKGAHSSDWDNQMAGEGNPIPRLQGARGLVDPRGILESGWGSCNPSLWLAEQYDKEHDTRYPGTLIDYEKLMEEVEGFRVSNTSGWYMYTGYGGAKYHARAGYSSDNGVRELNYEMNFRQMRYAEVLLVAAEAIARGSKYDISLAQEYYDQVRIRAYKEHHVQKPFTRENWKQRIIEERCLELALEGFRYWDLMRLDLGDQYLKDLGWKPFNRYMPIPQSTIDTTNGKIRQNDEY